MLAKSEQTDMRAHLARSSYGTLGDHLVAADDAFGDLLAWRQAGMRAALVTLIAIEGTTPRPLGAQMAVSSDGRFSGYLSGGCLEDSVAMEAVAAMAAGANRLVRYGAGSPYFDVKLPCGSGLDLYFDQGLSLDVIAEAARLRARRTPFVLETILESGESRVVPLERTAPRLSTLSDGAFHRVMLPRARVLLVGSGPALPAIAQMMAAAGFALDVVSPDEAATSDAAGIGIPVRGLSDCDQFDPGGTDPFTAAIVAFHEHDWEAPVLARILDTDCFYIGVMGSKKAHADRITRLAELGVGREALGRLKSPIGAIPGAKSRMTLAVGILAEVTAAAKAAGLVA